MYISSIAQVNFHKGWAEIPLLSPCNINCINRRYFYKMNIFKSHLALSVIGIAVDTQYANKLNKDYQLNKNCL